MIPRSQAFEQSLPPRVPQVPASSQESLSAGGGQQCLSNSGNVPDKVCMPTGDMPGCRVDYIIEAELSCPCFVSPVDRSHISVPAVHLEHVVGMRGFSWYGTQVYEDVRRIS